MIRKPAVLVIAFSISAILAASAVINEPYGRNISGTVTDKGGEPLKGAIVQLKNLTSLQVLSYITQTDGKYRFSGLHTETDYELRVLYKGNLSGAKRVGRLDSRKNKNVDLCIHVPVS
ncbi:MAG: carboxypeptidase regulatory-like domain-containing protein [Acidobacteriaceae bacterium]|nr:carboxypeptidase regulatory-like domain-containing protein [Acidobacteriaceae bacterium]